MKVHKAATSQFRCNLCCDWHNSLQPLIPICGINFCEGCFEKVRDGTSVKVLDPVHLDVYELMLRRTGLPSDEARSTNIESISQLTEFYRRQAREEKLKSLFDLFGEFQRIQGEAFQASEPFHDFLNDLYRRQLKRIESIWRSTLSEVDRTATIINAERKRIKRELQSYEYDFQRDEAALVDPVAHASKLQEVRSQLEELVNMNLGHLKQAFGSNPDMFFSNDFSLKQTLLQPALSPKLIALADLEDSQLLQFTDRSEVGGQVGPSCLPDESMLLLDFSQKKIDPVSAEPTMRQPTRREANQMDKQNILNCSPLVFKQRGYKEGKPTNSTYLSTRKEASTQRDNSKRPNTTNKPRKTLLQARKLDVYPPIDLTTLKEWPRQRILELLNRRDNVPKGFTDKRPSILRVYPQRVMTSTICEALDNTLCTYNAIELIGYPTQDLQFLGYLEMLKWTPRVQLVKFVKVGLTDENFNLLLCFVARCERISSLVVSNNYLTEQSVMTLLNFSRLHQQLKSVYIGKNYVNHQRAKAFLAELRQMGTLVYV